MTQSQIFGTARWVQAGTPGPDLQRPARPDSPHFPILRRTFDVTSVKKATLQVLGLGFFTCRVNGVPVSEDHFLPLFTDYQPRKDYPIEEKVTGHRIYVPEYDVTPLLREGKNALTIHFGGGWYTADSSFYEATRKFGDAKAIYRLTLETEAGVEELVSSTADQFTDSFVKTYDLITHEDQDYRGYDETIHGVDYDGSALPCVSEAAPLPEETRYLRTDAPADRLAETLPVTLLGCDGDTKYYAVEKEITGWPVLKLKAAPCHRLLFRKRAGKRQARPGLPPFPAFLGDIRREGTSGSSRIHLVCLSLFLGHRQCGGGGLRIHPQRHCGHRLLPVGQYYPELAL